MNSYPLALFLHIVIVACLLGADLGRLYLARAGAAPATEPTARLLAVRAVLWLGAIGDIALILIFPAGFQLATTLDAYRIDSPAWRLAPWLLPAVLLVLTVAADRGVSRAGGGRAVGTAETVARAVVGAGQVWDGASVIFLGMTHMVEARWLAAKLSIYGVLLLVSIVTRRAVLQLRRAMAAPDPAGSVGAALAPAFGRLQAALLASGILVLMIAWLGTAKPG